MIRTVLAFAAVGALVAAQDFPNDVDQVVALAMKSHPDVLLAEAKVRQAEAELMQAKMKAAREAIEVWKQRRNLELDLDAAEKELETKSELAKAGTASAESLDAARTKFDRLRAEVVDSRAVARFMLGVGLAPKAVEAPQQKTEPPPAPPQRPAMNTKLAGQLGETGDVALKDVPLPEAVASIVRKAGINLLIDAEVVSDAESVPISLELKAVTHLSALGAMLEMGNFALVQRDYGLLLTWKNKAQAIRAATIPHDLRLDE